MKRQRRQALSASLSAALTVQSKRLRRLRTHQERYDASVANWSKVQPEIKALLIHMNRGHDRCMYCEYSEAGTVDHFCPRSKDPKQAFHWPNLILACERCQTAKRTGFSKLVLNPTNRTYQPWVHLDFEPTTGEYIAISDQAKASEPIYKWGRGHLPQYRRNSFWTFQAAIIAYAEAGNAALAQQQRTKVENEPHPGIFDWILHWVETNDPRLDSRCRQAILDHPEIRGWLS